MKPKNKKDAWLNDTNENITKEAQNSTILHQFTIEEQLDQFSDLLLDLLLTQMEHNENKNKSTGTNPGIEP